jgi:hypothetical protein
MRISPIAIALTCAIAATPVSAKEKPTNDQAAAAAKADDGQTAEEDGKADKNRKICRTEGATGSVMPKRVCRTAAEIAALQEQAAKTKESMRN